MGTAQFISRDKHSMLVQDPDGEVQLYAIQKVNELKEDAFLPRPDLYGIEEDAEKEELRKKSKLGSELHRMAKMG